MDSTYELKVKRGFRFFDRDHDGLVSKKDMAKVADIICSLTNTSPEEAEITKYEWVKWCEIFPGGDTGGCTIEEWVATMLKVEAECEDEIRKGDKATYGNMFDRLDSNKDGLISREELGLYYEAFGVTDKKFVEKVFRQLDLDEDGYITKDEFVTAGVEYWSSDTGYEFMYDVPDTSS